MHRVFEGMARPLMAQTQCDYDDRVLVRRRYIAEAEAEDKSQVRRALTLFLAADE